MAEFENIEELIAEVNTSTNEEATALQAVSDRIDKLIAKLPVGGLDATQTAQLKDQLTQIRDAQTPIKDRLTALGQDPDNPIPTP